MNAIISMVVISIFVLVVIAPVGYLLTVKMPGIMDDIASHISWWISRLKK